MLESHKRLIIVAASSLSLCISNAASVFAQSIDQTANPAMTGSKPLAGDRHDTTPLLPAQMQTQVQGQTTSAEVPNQLHPINSTSGEFVDDEEDTSRLLADASLKKKEDEQDKKPKTYSIWHPIQFARPLFFGAVDEVHGFHAELDSLQHSLNNLDPPLNQLGTPIDNLQSQVGRLTTSVRHLHDPINKMLTPLGGIQTQMYELQRPLDNFAGTLKSVDRDLAKLSSLNEPVRTLSTSTERIGAPLAQMSGTLASLNKPLAGLTNDIQTLKEPLMQIATPLNAVAAPLNTLRQPLTSIGSDVGKLSEDLHGVEGELKQFRSSLDKLTSTLSIVILSLAALIILLVVGGIAGIIWLAARGLNKKSQ